MRALFFIPVYNQAREFPRVLAEIAGARLSDTDFLLVNNGSTDGSEQQIQDSGHWVLHIPRNLGVGYSYIRAIEWALEREYMVFGAMAANGKMLPSEIPRLLDPLRSGKADYVTGSRFLEGGSSPNLPLFRRGAIPLVSLFASAVVGRRLTDATNGFRAFRLGIMKKASFDWHAEWLYTYAFEYFLYAKVLLDRSLVGMEVPTTMRYPETGSYSKIRSGRDWICMLEPWVRARLDRHGFRP